MRIPDHIKKKQEYREFIEWIGLPVAEREPKEQKQFALKVGVGPQQLSGWKNEEGFWETVRIERLKWAQNKTSNVLLGLYGSALKGNPNAVKLFLEYAGEFVETLKIKTDKSELSDKDKELLKQALKYGGIKANKNRKENSEKAKQPEKDKKEANTEPKDDTGEDNK